MSEEEIKELIRKIEEGDSSPEEGELRCWMHD